MDWFDAPALERVKLTEDVRTFNKKAEAVWGGLKLMLKATVENYMDRYPAAQFNKTMAYDDTDPNAPKVIRKATGAVVEATLTITFSTPQIVAASSKSIELFNIARDDNGYIGLTYEDAAVSLDRAAEIILKPILFYDQP